MTQQPTKQVFFSDEEIEHYQRQLILPEIGGAGQQKLKCAKILVIGAGGLGAPSLLYLAGAGVGHIGIIDSDKVEASNLQRQIIFDQTMINQSKALSAKKRLETLNPYIQITAYPEILTKEKAQSLFTEYDIIIDGSDNFDTRYFVADCAELTKKPLITGAIERFRGSLTVLMPYEKNNPSYRDLFPQKPPKGYSPPCQLAGVIGPLAGIIGSLEALEALKLILNTGTPLIGRLLYYDALTTNFKIFHYKKNVNLFAVKIQDNE